MSKRIKIEAIIDIEDTLHIDDVLLKRTISSIGEVHSCKIESNFEDKDSNKKLEVPGSLDKTVSEIDHFINDANKIYFGTLSVDERKFVAASILHSSSISNINNDPEFTHFTGFLVC